MITCNPRAGSISEAKKLFAGSVFNLLVDYYTEVPFRPYGSGATRRNVIPVLKDLKPGHIIMYAKGHSGHTTFPSSLHTEHAMLDKDMPAFFREVTRTTGTRLFLYYSGMLDGIAGMRHPGWRMLDEKGDPRQYFKEFDFVSYGNCPLSDYFDEWVAVHLKELISRYDPDGIWVDGDWAGPCYCGRCRKRFRTETGFSHPSPDVNTPEGAAWEKVWARITHEWRMKFSSFVKTLKPSCMYSAGNVTARKEFLAAFDWRSGDWFSPNNHRLHMSVSMRRYTTLNVPYDAFTCDTSFVHGRAEMRARTKTLSRMLQEGATLLANGGLWGYWTYPMPNGAFVPSKMRMAKKAAAFARRRKNCCLHTEHFSRTAVLNTAPGGYLSELAPNIMGAGKALIALHCSPVFMDESGLETGTGPAGKIKYDLIVNPENRMISDADVDKLEKFVREGGKLLSTGAAMPSKRLQALLGVRPVRQAEIDDGHVFLKNGLPAGVYAPWTRLELKGARELHPLYLSWDHFNPETRRIRPCYPITGMVDEENPEKAGMPAATVRKLGKGVAVHIPTNFFDRYWQYGNPDMLSWLQEILDFIQPDPFFRTDAPSFVEVSLRRKKNRLLIHFINGNPGRDISLVDTNDLWVDDIPEVGPITCRITCKTKPGKIYWEPGKIPAEATFRNGILNVVLPRLKIHCCLVIDGVCRDCAVSMRNCP